MGILGFMFTFLFRFVPPFPGLTPLAMNILGIFIGAMVFWLFVDVDWTSVLILVALIMSPLYTFGKVMQESIGSWVTCFIVFTSAFCYVLTKHGFFRRTAVWMLTRKISQRSPWSFLIMLSITAVLVGSFLATVTTYMIFRPIMDEIFKELGYKKEDQHRIPKLITIIVLLFICYGNYTTPISTVPLVGLALYTRFSGGLHITFFQYSSVGVLLTLICAPVMILILKAGYKADFSALKSINTEFLLRDQKPMSKQEKIAVSAFLGCVFFWVIPDVISGIMPAASAFLKSLGTLTPPMVGIVLLCVIKIDGESVMDLPEAFSKGVSWSTFLLISAAQLIGDAVTHESVQITTWLGDLIAPTLSRLPTLVCVLIIVQFAIILTNFTSNTVTITLSTSIAVPMVISGALPGLSAPALTFVLAMAAIVATATPASAPSPAIATGDGWIDVGTMFAWGMPLCFLNGFALAFIGYPIATMIMGY
jgi:sodium-dependent dicarboxylate transporter 2/3/5